MLVTKGGRFRSEDTDSGPGSPRSEALSRKHQKKVRRYRDGVQDILKNVLNVF